MFRHLSSFETSLFDDFRRMEQQLDQQRSTRIPYKPCNTELYKKSRVNLFVQTTGENLNR